jgi:shikimate kinase
MGKYFLIGVPNCGKSTLGKLDADIMKLPFYDTDTMAVELLELKNPLDIFRQVFNRGFMNAQRAAMQKIVELDGPAIVSTGAEIALMPECAQSMRAIGTVIHVKRSIEKILENLQNVKPRVVLREGTKGTIIGMNEEGLKLYMQEYSQYEAIADVALDNDGSEDEGVQKLIILINQSPHNKPQ